VTAVGGSGLMLPPARAPSNDDAKRRTLTWPSGRVGHRRARPRWSRAPREGRGAKCRATARRGRDACVARVAMVGLLGPLRYAVRASLRTCRHFLVPAFVACDSPCLAAAPPDPLACAFLRRSRTCHHFPVVALAAVLLALSPAFSRFDEILYLVEKASDLTLPDAMRPLLRPCSNRASPYAAATVRSCVPFSLSFGHCIRQFLTDLSAIERTDYVFGGPIGSPI
jgi:hypothetical protein